MKVGRRIARTLAFETLFEMDSRLDRDLEVALNDRIAATEEEVGDRISKNSVRFARKLVTGARQRRTQIDELVSRIAPAFPIEQMAMTDRVALEVAVYEMLHDGSSPVKVVINEAVQLAKTYGGENSGRFVNGVLGTIAEELTVNAGHPAHPVLDSDNTSVIDTFSRR